MQTLFDKIRQLLTLPMSDSTLKGKLQVLVAESEESEERAKLEKLLSFPMSDGTLRVKLSLLVENDSSNATNESQMLNEETPVIETEDLVPDDAPVADDEEEVLTERAED